MPLAARPETGAVSGAWPATEPAVPATPETAAATSDGAPPKSPAPTRWTVAVPTAMVPSAGIDAGLVGTGAGFPAAPASPPAAAAQPAAIAAAASATPPTVATDLVGARTDGRACWGRRPSRLLKWIMVKRPNVICMRAPTSDYRAHRRP